MQLQTGLLLAVLTVAGFSCKTPATSNSLPTGDNSMTSLDWNGVYTGVLPCADCEGIETTLQLMKDKTYTLTRNYLGKSSEPVTSSGTFTWDASGANIQLSGEDPGKYKVGENQLMHLDKDGNRITGELAANYVLAKDVSGITEKYWKLVELNGQPVTKTDDMRKEPHMILRTAGRRVNAHGGCNSYMGSYELQPGNRIRFTKMAGTLMACPNMEVEDRFRQVLEMADNYNLNGDTLFLNKAKMAPLARFEAVYLK
ncbi:copper resistance protein NlpE N-terminal domain-containing protein [Flavihumibacter cheonanensis]|uniref:copper resistance protein NlpE N-terminal domain-containing protein n=1 Tax=Flavihumibacter cheonanensis TaxID=1442385 RepID=UPI001EF8268F|nr:copper resistance protein NlpE N-terminal domain-containing protein [Flavihumibacter cheonanensis]MCG7754198.1 copper resistance protein NlpE N-terminal domain-containing protein [Flavihumibacter cheonanensis]